MLDAEKTVFISYRRNVGRYLARAVFMDLKAHGFDAFMDVESIDSGTFDTIILEQIASRAHFVVILTPGSLERCAEPGDWLRREIEHAMDSQRNIVPVLVDSFSFEGAEPYLTGKLSQLKRYNALPVRHDYFEEAMDRLRNRFLAPQLSKASGAARQGQPSTVDARQTDGGAHVERDVTAGTFIGRDQIVVISGYTGEDLERVLSRLQEVLSTGRAELCADVAQERLTVTAPDAPSILLSSEAAGSLLPVASRRADELAYLTALLVNPRYGRWATQFVPLAGTLTTFERPPGWTDVPPEFTLLEMSGQGPERRIRPVRLEDITQAIAQHDALVILGEPGAGKTTVLYKLALDAAQTWLTTGEGKLPLYLSLADYRGFASPYAFVEAVGQQFFGGADLAERLRRGELLLLVDALNEMPFRDGRDYRERVGAWNRFVSDWPGNKVLFTCRSRNYSEPLGLHQVRIERLDDGRVRAFLEKYLAQDLARESWARLDGSPLLELVRNPYYLSMLAYILAKGEAWPAGRAGMLDDFVRLLLTREQVRNHPDWLGVDPLRGALSALAEGIQPLGEGTRLPRREVLGRVPAQVEGPDGPVDTPPPTVLRLGLAATLLDTELAPDGEPLIRFYHHQLQEYFAASALLARWRAQEELSDRWGQPRLAREMPDPGPLGDFEPLPPPPAIGWEEPTLLAAGLASDPVAFVEAVRRVNPVLAARCLVEAGEGGGVSARLRRAVQTDLLHEMADEQVHLRARIAAGEALGRLGDPRFQEVEVRGRRVLLPPLVEVPAGRLRMGSGRWHVWRLARRGFPARDERPQHDVNLPALFIGRFPVTRGEFACFVEAGGYREENAARYWPTAAARAWLRGEAVESAALREAMDLWRAIRDDPEVLKQLQRAGWGPQALAGWGQLAQMEEREVREALERVYTDRPRDRPGYWDDEAYANPSQPVVGVTWFEALAYCRWLSEQLRVAGCGLQVWRDGQPGAWRPASGAAVTVRLPTEAEWERAARMDRGWVYPWGNRWDAGQANTWEGHVLRPAPVGVYPGGATPEGVHDLSGQVWEWTASLYRPYPYRPRDGREDLEADGRRVVRGGSWADGGSLARCAYRNRDAPDNWDFNQGFRVVLSPGSPSAGC